MKKLHFIFLAFLALNGLFINTTKAQKSEKIKGEFIHAVYFWLNNPESVEDCAKFEASLKKFVNSSVNITGKHIGKPAKTDRSVIDNTYTYSLILTFKNKETQDKYQEEPAHKLFIQESESLWKKVLVYDSETIL